MDTYPMISHELRSERYACVWDCLHSPKTTITFETGGVWVRVPDSLNEGKYICISAHPDCYEQDVNRERRETHSNPSAPESSGHLGYKNYLTASVALWIDNTREIAPWIHLIADIYHSDSCAETDEDAVSLFAGWLREYVESTFPDIEDGVGNIFLAVSRDQVDWNELAERYINRER